MGRYILRRLLIAIPVLFGITIAAFAALALAPGDPITARIPPEILARLTPEIIAQRRHELGLDQPIYIQYLHWFLGLIRGDLGYSITSGLPIWDEVVPRIAPTLLLMTTALGLGVGLGVPIGVVAALKRNTAVDYVLTGFTVVMIVIPQFVLALVAIYVFGVFLPVLPTRGMTTLGASFSPIDLLAHLILPASILGFAFAAPIARYARASMLDVLNADYVTTARAKGLTSRVVLFRHAFRNGLLPIVTVIGLFLPELVAGAVIVEQIFSWPGMGSLAVRAANDRDPALMMGGLLIVATGVLLANLLIDVAYASIDPRVRLG
jgi:peptide/nickel transport system permease protein